LPATKPNGFRSTAIKGLDAYEQQLTESAKQNAPPPKPLAPYREGYIAYFQAEQVEALLKRASTMRLDT
jgi:hypothetical protein